MNEQHQNKLRELRSLLLSQVNPHQLTDYLVEKHILVNEDVEVINGKATTKAKARALIDILPTRGPNAFDVFVSALEQYKDDSELKALAAQLKGQ